MQEFVSRGVVLDIEPRGEQDVALTVFTEHFGKVTARVQSMRKITSKLAGHFQPGNVVRVRFVEARVLRAVEGLQEGRRTDVSAGDLHLLARLLPEFEPDDDLWSLFFGNVWSWRDALRLLGWDGTHTRCGGCDTSTVAGFAVHDQRYYCISCASKIGKNNVVWIRPGAGAISDGA